VCLYPRRKGVATGGRTRSWKRKPLEDVGHAPFTSTFADRDSPGRKACNILYHITYKFVLRRICVYSIDGLENTKQDTHLAQSIHTNGSFSYMLFLPELQHLNGIATVLVGSCRVSSREMKKATREP
jgi:hypothetical protein